MADGGGRGGTDVLVVGAGPTGLMAAALLHRAGVSVRILDRSPTAAKESRAFGIQARSMELFLGMGLAETLLDRGLMVTGAEVYVGGKRAAGLDFDDIGRADTPFPFLLMVPQSEIEAVLVDHLASNGIAVERGTEVTAFAQTPDGIDAQARNAAGGTLALAGRYLVGADGAHSMVRKALGLSFEGAAYPQTFLLADCRIDWPLDLERLKLFVNEGGFGIHLPLKGQAIGRVMAIDPSPPAADGSIDHQGSSAVSLPEVEAAFRSATGLDVALADPVWTSRYRIHHRGVNRYGIGRAFVAGDAAHIHSPAGGQGMNTGLQDAANLAWKLALVLKGAAGPELLDSYDAERRPVGERVLAYTDRAFTAMTSQAGWVASLREAILPVAAATVSRLGFARARAFHFVSQLGIRYEPGPFVRDDASGRAGSAFRHGPAAGRRAPNAAIARGRDVFDLLCGYRFHLLAFSRIPLGETEVARVAGDLAALAEDAAPIGLETTLLAHSLIGRDPRLVRAEAPQAFAAYGVDADTPQALYLVRPDGYVAWRSDSLDVAGCRRFLAERFAMRPAS